MAATGSATGRTSVAHSYWNVASTFVSAKWQELAQTDLGRRVSTYIGENQQAQRVVDTLQSRGGKDATAGATIAAFLLIAPGQGFGWGVVKTAVGASAMWCYKRYYNPAPAPAAVISVAASPVPASGRTSPGSGSAVERAKES